MMLPLLIRASIEGGLLVAVIWALTRALPRLPAGTRTVLWWCAAAKFVLSLVWTVPIPLAVLPSAPPPAVAVSIDSPSDAARPFAGPIGQNAGSPQIRDASRWSSAALALWAVGASIALGFAVRRWLQARAIIARSGEADAVSADMVAELASRLRLSHVPPVRASNAVDTPLVAGLLRPTIVVPERFTALTIEQQQMALCHELAHVRRKDLWLGCIPALAERVFFFHPLAHLAAREYGLWREAACDAAVIELLDAPAAEYGRLLLDLGVSSRHTGLAAAGASWSFTSLKRRLDMLRIPSSRTNWARGLSATAIAIAIGGTLPLKMTARPTEPRTESTASQTASSPLAAASSSAGAGVEQEPEASRLNYVLFLDDDHTTMSASDQDVRQARRFKTPGEPVMWFRSGGREYIVRDVNWIRDIERLWRPVGEIGEEQGKIGEMQGAIGEKQGEVGQQQGAIGQKQGAIGAKQGDLGQRQGELASREAAISGRERDRAATTAERDLLAKERRKIDEEMRELDRQMQALDGEMRALDAKMRELDEPMRELDGKMKGLDRQMHDAVAAAEAEMRARLDHAVQTGLATAVK